jgi:LisH domain-containing protein ARMC9
MNPSAPTSTQRTKSEDMRIKHAVLEFLRYHGMKNTMECFEVESQQKLKETTTAFSPRSSGRSGTDGVRFRVKRDMLACFEDGLSARFFSSWDKNVPMDLRDQDKTCQKLEFYVQLHFATLPFRPSFLRKMAQKSRDNPGAAKSAASAAASAMLAFRKYLESRGKILSSSPEFLQYYALPYVPNPMEHPSFKGVFKPQWPLDIRVRLERFLDVVLQSVTLPELYSIFDIGTSGQHHNGGQGGGGAGGGEGTLGMAMQLPSDTSEVRKVRAQVQATFMGREEKLKDFARNIYSVSIEMLRELERAGARNGQPVRPEFVTFAKSRLDMFSEVLSQKGLTSTSAALEKSNVKSSAMMNGSGIGQKVGLESKDGSSDQQGGGGGGVPLDYSAVRDDLAKLSDLIVEHNADSDTLSSRKCARLLQALRWKLSRTRPRATRQQLLKQYIGADLLGCTSTKTRVGGAPDLLLRLLTMSERNPLVLEYACRFVNLIASDSEGRSYLLQHNNLIQMLVGVLRVEKADSFARQNALGALQKFSLRREAQTTMIEEDLIKWIATILREHTDTQRPDVELSEYTVEYATALLMNLSVRTLGKIKCEDPNVKILDAMNNLLENENHQVRSYVNGTLYSVLSRPTLRERALQMGMDEMMKQLMKDSDEEFRTQVEYILEQLQKEDMSEEVSDGEEEDDQDDPDEDEDDDMMDDDEENETLDPPTESELQGDDLLNSMYQQQQSSQSSPSQQRNTQQQIQNQQRKQQIIQESQSPPKNNVNSENNNNENMADEMGTSLTKAEAVRNETLMKTMGGDNQDREKFMSKPRISRTPQVRRREKKDNFWNLSPPNLYSNRTCLISFLSFLSFLFFSSNYTVEFIRRTERV